MLIEGNVKDAALALAQHTFNNICDKLAIFM